MRLQRWPATHLAGRMLRGGRDEEGCALEAQRCRPLVALQEDGVRVACWLTLVPRAGLQHRSCPTTLCHQHSSPHPCHPLTPSHAPKAAAMHPGI